MIITIIILADHGRLPHFIRVIYDFPNGDKLGHFILFGLLNFFITGAVLASRLSESCKRVSLSIGLALAVLIALEEYSQQFFSARTFSLLDLLASYAGLLVGGWMALGLKKRQSPASRK
ncbi:MAG TPA: VanZ family protein [Anaerolineales bacterium]|nr:VanZ family protein [Anaerolineales bacterium]